MSPANTTLLLFNKIIEKRVWEKQIQMYRVTNQ
jgi:hypothetical protein